jgi:hypothetical protein
MRASEDAAVECFVPLTYAIHPARSLVVVTRTHTASADEWERFMAQIMSDPTFVRGLNLVDDSRAVTAVPSRAEVERAARWINDHAGELGPARWAIVVAPSALAPLVWCAWPKRSPAAAGSACAPLRTWRRLTPG